MLENQLSAEAFRDLAHLTPEKLLFQAHPCGLPLPRMRSDFIPVVGMGARKDGNFVSQSTGTRSAPRKPMAKLRGANCYS